MVSDSESVQIGEYPSYISLDLPSGRTIDDTACYGPFIITVRPCEVPEAVTIHAEGFRIEPRPSS
jgi:hypothetical protein